MVKKSCHAHNKDIPGQIVGRVDERPDCARQLLNGEDLEARAHRHLAARLRRQARPAGDRVRRRHHPLRLGAHVPQVARQQRVQDGEHLGGAARLRPIHNYRHADVHRVDECEARALLLPTTAAQLQPTYTILFIKSLPFISCIPEKAYFLKKIFR